MTDQQEANGALDVARVAELAMFGLAAPQPRYRDLIDAGGYLPPTSGLAMTFSRELTEFVLRNHELFSSTTTMSLGNVRPLIPLNVDPPQHSKYRKIMDPLFSPKQMDRQEADITGRVNGLIDSFIDRGECNFTEEFAEIFPSSVFLGLMGLPESELRPMLHMRDGILHPEKIDPAASTDIEARRAVSTTTGAEIYRYFEDWLDRRTQEPQDDILTHFLTAEIDGERLTREEILDTLFLFLIAGLDTVSDSLTCFWAFLAQHDEHRRELVDDPELIPNAVEELLRWESPVPGSVPRTATRDVELPNGMVVPAGVPVRVSYGAANVDPDEFEDAFEVRFDRQSNRHLAFGGGVHRCLGSHLARRELRIALREWHRRIPDYHLKPGHEQLEYPQGLRHVKDLTLSWS